MKLVSLALALTLTATAQTVNPAPQFTDPANLRGERVRPRDGRELPIDGGLGADGKPNTALALQQILRRLNTRGSILNIVAHPDDEDGGMLTFYSRGLGARVADLSLTRGEGGQNAMTGDFEDALGLLRTQELLANDRYVGVDQMFGTEVDFGFSKTKSEAFAKWTHDRVLYDAVRAVRLYRPLVITSTWIGSVTDGHGQHQASGQIAQEAFLKAGDPNVFPDMIAEGILPWQPLRIYARVPTQSISEKGLFDYATGQYVAPTFTNYVTGEVTTTPPTTDVIVHEGQTDSLLTAAAASAEDLKTTHFDAPANAPLTYVQFSRIGLGLQRSQIPAGFRMPPSGTFDVPYHLYGSCATPDFKACHPGRSAEREGSSTITQPNFFTGMDTSVLSLQDIAPGSFPTDAIYDISRAVSASIKDLDPSHPEAIAPLLAEALQDDEAIIKSVEGWKGDPIQKASVLHELRIKQVQLNDALVLALGVSLDATVKERARTVGSIVHATTILSTQSADPVSDVRERILDSMRNGIGDGQASEGGPTPQKGRPFFRELTLGPPYANLISEPYFHRDNIEQAVYKLRDPQLRNAAMTPPAATVTAEMNYRSSRLTLSRVVHEGRQPFAFVSPDSATYRSIGYGDLPRTIYYPPAPKHVSLVGINLPSKRRIAYLPGTGDAVPEALASIGLPVTTLTVADLTPSKLAKFDTVVLGVRTYAAHPDLHGAPTQALLDYAKAGGNVLVQYQTAEFTASDSPYPLTLGRDAEKVVDETAPVHLLLPAQPGTAPGGMVKNVTSPTPIMEYALLNTPNIITSADFNGWVEERGHGFLHTWDPHYAALTETHDPGSPSEGVLPQAPQRGGLVTTPLGKGRWTYCAFALYRQLPEAVPGAFRIFLNLINP